jgi:hypothetical protein
MVIIESPGNFPPFRADALCDMLPRGAPHEVGGQHSILVLYTVIHHVGEDPQNFPVPLRWPKVKNRTDSGRMCYRSMRRMVAILARVYNQMSVPSLQTADVSTYLVDHSVCAVIRVTALYPG